MLQCWNRILVLVVVSFMWVSSAPLLGQPVLEVIPQLPWQYDTSTGEQVGAWEYDLVLTDPAAPIVAYGVWLYSWYDGADDVPYYGFANETLVTPFMEFDLTGTPAENAEYISPMNLLLDAAVNANCGSPTGCEFRYGQTYLFSTSAPFTAVDFSGGVNVGRVKFNLTGSADGLINDFDGSYFASQPVSSGTYGVVTYEDGTEAFIGNQTLVEHSLTTMPILERGDVNLNGVINITDAILIFFYAFGQGTASFPVGCLDIADCNDDGVVDISDPVYILIDVYEGGPPPPPPNVGSCGPDPTPDGLICDGQYCP
jgi:hypothetical protein